MFIVTRVLPRSWRNLSKHRKALMLFGTFHTMHSTQGSAVSLYEKDYPNLTFVISELGIFDTDLPSLHDSKFVNWPIPSLARKGHMAGRVGPRALHSSGDKDRSGLQCAP